MKIQVLNLTMILKWDVYILEIGVLVRSILYHLTCLRHSNRSRAVTNRIFLLQKDIFSFMHSHHVLIYQQYKYHESDCMSKNLYLGRLGPWLQMPLAGLKTQTVVLGFYTVDTLIIYADNFFIIYIYNIYIIYKAISISKTRIIFPWIFLEEEKTN